MYLIIRKDKSEHLKEKAHRMKELACEVISCLEEVAQSQETEEYNREYARRRDREHYPHDGYSHEGYRHDPYYDDREMARGRGRGRY